MRDVNTKVDGVDSMPAENYNAQRSELENAVLSADISLDPDAGPDTDLNMLGKTMGAYANAANVYQDSGAADAYVLSLTTNLKSVTKYYDNMMIVFKAGNSNTGASTVNVETLGVKSITLPDGTALSADAIISGNYIIAVYNLSSTRFELVDTILVASSVTDQGGGNNLLFETSEIGAWDMSAATGSATVNVTTGIAREDFRQAYVFIRNDLGDSTNDLGVGVSASDTTPQGYHDPANNSIDLTRLTGGTFDSVFYNKTFETIDNAAAVDKGGGLVGIPITGHTFWVGDSTTIAGTTNYNGTHTIVSVTANEIVIADTFVSETFAGTETASWGRGFITITYKA